MSLAIETHQLTRFFDGFCAVNGIDLRVERGTFYGFLGPNGAGKSTTIKMLTGLLAPSGGQVLVLGKNMLDPRESLEAKRRVGVIPEDLALFDNLTAREYLTFVGRMYLLPRDTIRSRIGELLPLLGLENEEKKLTLEYSHGMKKKLALAAALLPNPDLLFLDEPFEGVDAVTSHVIRDLLAGFVGPRLDGLSDVARPGNRREALHARRHHRQGAAGRAGRRWTTHPPRRVAGRAVPRKGRRRRGGDAEAQLARGGGAVNVATFPGLRLAALAALRQPDCAAAAPSTRS